MGATDVHPATIRARIAAALITRAIAVPIETTATELVHTALMHEQQRGRTNREVRTPTECNVTVTDESSGARQRRTHSSGSIRAH